MMYVYTVWLRKLDSAEDDQDRDWPACFVIDGTSELAARGWGDHLAGEYARRTKQIVLNSKIEVPWSGCETLPVIREGTEASDSDIGW